MSTPTASQPMPMRLSAYYYSFDSTGVLEVDRVLSAVAWAGKAYHHTDQWNEDAGERDGLKGNTPVEWIQNAANALAHQFARSGEVESVLREAFRWADPWCDDNQEEPTWLTKARALLRESGR